jgi:ankyrin repeat protein
LDDEGKTPLMVAAKAGAPEIVELLLRAGADPTPKDKLGYTAEMIAYWYGEYRMGAYTAESLKIVEMLRRMERSRSGLTRALQRTAAPLGRRTVRIICQRLLQPTGRFRRRSLSLVVSRHLERRFVASTAVARVVAVASLVAWSAFWFWAFSFAYSDSFFEYNRHTRIAAFVAVLLSAILLPISAVYWWLRPSASVFWPLLGHIATSLVVLALPAAVTAVLSRADPPWHLSADDAMGVGIDYLFLLGIAIASLVVMLVAMGVRSYRRRIHQ